MCSWGSSKSRWVTTTWWKLIYIVNVQACPGQYVFVPPPSEVATQQSRNTDPHHNTAWTQMLFFSEPHRVLFEEDGSIRKCLLYANTLKIKHLIQTEPNVSQSEPGRRETSADRTKRVSVWTRQKGDGDIRVWNLKQSEGGETDRNRSALSFSLLTWRIASLFCSALWLDGTIRQ